MAALGGVVQHYVKFPGFDSVPAGIGAVTTPPGTYGFVALFLASGTRCPGFAGAPATCSYPREGAMELAVWTEDPSKEARDDGYLASLQRSKASSVNEGW